MKKVAAIQMCSSNRVEENLAMAAKLIKEAAEQEAALVVLPEMFPIFGLNPVDTVRIKEKFADFEQGEIQAFLSEQAKEKGVWLVGGTIPLSCDDDTKINASCLVYDSNGSIVASDETWRAQSAKSRSPR